MDYIIADRIVRRHAISNRILQRRSVHLPDGFFASDPKRAIGPAPTRKEAGLLGAWLRLLAVSTGIGRSPGPCLKSGCGCWLRSPGSVLWLNDDGARETLCREAKARGVDPARLLFAPKLAIQADHLARMRLADLILDTSALQGALQRMRRVFLGGRAAGYLPGQDLFPGAGRGEPADHHGSSGADCRKSGELRSDRPGAGGRCQPAGRNSARLADNRASSPLFDTDRFPACSIETALCENVLEAAERQATARDVSGPRYGKGPRTRIPQQPGTATVVALWGQGRREDAIASFAKAVAINPSLVEAWNNHVVRPLQGMERPEQALASYDRALALTPAYADALLNRADVLQAFEKGRRKRWRGTTRSSR